jgi:hypothetical protein
MTGGELPTGAVAPASGGSNSGELGWGMGMARGLGALGRGRIQFRDSAQGEEGRKGELDVEQGRRQWRWAAAGGVHALEAGVT